MLYRWSVELSAWHWRCERPRPAREHRSQPTASRRYLVSGGSECFRWRPRLWRWRQCWITSVHSPVVETVPVKETKHNDKIKVKQMRRKWSNKWILKPSFSVNFATDPPQLKSQFLNAFIKSFKKLKTCKHRQFDLDH